MNLKQKLSATAFAFGMTCVSAPSFGQGVPVIDAANLVNSLQQVIAWGQQQSQMVQQIQQFAQQIQQMQNMTTKLDAARNLGTILSNPAIASTLPPQMANANQLLNAAISSGQQSAINSILSAYGVPTAANPTLGQGSAMAISDMQSVLASTQLRQGQLNQLATRVDSSPDAKDSLDLLNRNVIESAYINNQMIQTMAAIEAGKEAARLRSIAADEAIATAYIARLKATR